MKPRFFAADTSLTAAGGVSLGAAIRCPTDCALRNHRVYLVTHYYGGGAYELEAKLLFKTQGGQNNLIVPVQLSSLVAETRARVSFAAASVYPAADAMVVNWPDLGATFYPLPRLANVECDELILHIEKYTATVEGFKVFLAIHSEA